MTVQDVLNEKGWNLEDVMVCFKRWHTNLIDHIQEHCGCLLRDVEKVDESSMIIYVKEFD